MLHVPSTHLEATCQLLQRRGYLSDEGTITKQGEELYRGLLSGAAQSSKRIKDLKEKQETLFEKWWSCFPPNSGFEVGGRKFASTRALRTGKALCNELFTKIVNSGDYTGEQIIEATTSHINVLKKNSLREGKNNLHYLQNSVTYLRQRTFEAFMEVQDDDQDISYRVDNSIDL